MGIPDSRGLMPRRAFTNVFDQGVLPGNLNHIQMLDSQATAVSDRVVFLLYQPTTGLFFAYFPAVMSVSPTPLERRFSEEYEPAWLLINKK